MKECSGHDHKGLAKRIVITGGPGAGKTALLEIARKEFCDHITILPEAATILFGGGFWRHATLPGKKASQRAIYHIQRELEQLVEEENTSRLILCDRGTLDGLAYWPIEEAQFWREVNSSKESELARYDTVIHLRTPHIEHGYNQQNPVRIESAEQAAMIDKKIEEAWRDHPHKFIVESNVEFLEKVAIAMQIIKQEMD